MKIIDCVYICNDGVGEVQGMFEGGKLLGAWSLNDGQWSGEYFDGFLKKLGIQVRYANDRELEDKLRKEFL